MIGGGLSSDQRNLLETTRRFGEEVVAPVASELDGHPDPADCFSWDIVEKADAAGIRTATLAPEFGGAGIDSLTTAIVVEELGKYDLGVSVVLAQTLKIAQTLQAAATPDQLARYMPDYAADPRGLLAIAITEPDRASDYIIPFAAGDFRTRAVRTDGGWVINGQKHFISNGNRARFYLVFAQTDAGAGLAAGSTCFLIERDAPGFTIGRVHDKMGERLANNAELFFEDCFVPDDDVLGEVGKGFDVLVRFFPASNAYAAASVLGVAQAAYARALEWTRTRYQGGSYLLEKDSVAVVLSRMRMRIDASQAYLQRAAWMADNRDQGWDPKMGALPKVFASEVAWEVVTSTLELHGGYGYMRDMGVEKLVRDAAAFLHSDGANTSLLLKAARFIRQDAPVPERSPSEG